MESVLNRGTKYISPKDAEIITAHSKVEILLVCFLMIIFSVILIVKYGFTVQHSMRLCGAILTIIGLMIFSIAIRYANFELGTIRTIIKTFSGIIPYLFGCYLILYDGFWVLIASTQHLSIITILKAIFLIIMGLIIINGIFQFCKFANRINKADIMIREINN